MTDVDNPDHKQIRAEFLAYVRKFHAEHSFTTDFEKLCEDLNIKLTSGSSNQYFTLQGRPRISYRVSDPENRQVFTILHELAHHLFRTSDEAYQDLLAETCAEKVAISIEEDLCDQAAGILLIPDHVLEEAVRKYGYDPKAVFELSERQGSLAACLRRLIQAHDTKAYGVILDYDGYVEFSYTNTLYPVGIKHRVESKHDIYQARQQHIETKAAVPFKSGSRRFKITMRADFNGRRIIGLFAKEFPHISDEQQPSLFT